MDLILQYVELEMTGELVFTPPLHIVQAFKEALLEFSDEGGIIGRMTKLVQKTRRLKNSFCFLLKNERKSSD